VTAYLDVVRDGARVELTRNNEQVLQRQLQATRDRFQVGEVTRTDVAQAEARLARANSDRSTAEGDLQISRATYERVVGNQPGKLEPPPPLPPLPTSLDEAAQAALRENPDLQRANYNEEAAKQAVRAALGVLYPSVNLVGRIQRTDEQVTEELQTRNDSIVAQVIVPLYQSGTEYAAVRQAKELRSQRMLDIEQARRVATEAARQSWEALLAARERIKGRSEQVRASEIALEGVRQEAAVGSRTTLDVLDAEQELLDSRVALVIADRDAYVAAYRVVASIGRLSAERLALKVPLYDPTQHYKEVRDKWIGLSPPNE
jgi:TolC family type I secretion outer membrane protein